MREKEFYDLGVVYAFRDAIAAMVNDYTVQDQQLVTAIKNKFPAAHDNIAPVLLSAKMYAMIEETFLEKADKAVASAYNTEVAGPGQLAQTSTDQVINGLAQNPQSTPTEVTTTLNGILKDFPFNLSFSHHFIVRLFANELEKEGSQKVELPAFGALLKMSAISLGDVNPLGVVDGIAGLASYDLEKVKEHIAALASAKKESDAITAEAQQRLMTALQETQAIIAAFRNIPNDPKNPTYKGDHVGLIAANDLLNKTKSAMGLAVLFTVAKPYVNKHEVDEEAGAKKYYPQLLASKLQTSSPAWRDFAAHTRAKMLETVEKESNDITDHVRRQEYLEEMKGWPVISEHYDNIHAAGATHAVRIMDLKIEEAKKMAHAHQYPEDKKNAPPRKYRF